MIQTAFPIECEHCTTIILSAILGIRGICVLFEHMQLHNMASLIPFKNYCVLYVYKYTFSLQTTSALKHLYCIAHTNLHIVFMCMDAVSIRMNSVMLWHIMLCFFYFVMLISPFPCYIYAYFSYKNKSEEPVCCVYESVLETFF